ncbi:MAG: hypothetical protein JXB35_10420 [Anaerolineae bacterium]|nr:hypothetical protein [Anaerolineae bacterium]
MALTNLQRVRLAIADRLRLVLNEHLGTGDGTTLHFQMGLFPVLDETDALQVDGVAQVRDTDYTIENDVGLVTFAAAPADGAAVRATYRWASFSDDELNDLLSEYGTVNAAAAAALRWLLADTERFIKYTFGQESVDRTAARKQIAGLLALLERRASKAVGLVKATNDDREALMYPFIEQPEDLDDDV